MFDMNEKSQLNGERLQDRKESKNYHERNMLKVFGIPSPSSTFHWLVPFLCLLAKFSFYSLNNNNNFNKMNIVFSRWHFFSLLLYFANVLFSFQCFLPILLLPNWVWVTQKWNTIYGWKKISTHTQRDGKQELWIFAFSTANAQAARDEMKECVFASVWNLEMFVVKEKHHQEKLLHHCQAKQKARKKAFYFIFCSLQAWLHWARSELQKEQTEKVLVRSATLKMTVMTTNKME